MKRILCIVFAMVLLCSTAFAVEAEGNLYQEWNKYAEANLWGDGYKTILDREALSETHMLWPHVNAMATFVGANGGYHVGVIAQGYIDGLKAKDFINGIADNLACYWEPDSVLCYLAEQNIGEDDIEFLQEECYNWIGKGEAPSLHEEIYKVRISVDGGREEYVIMILVVHDGYEDFAESVLVSSNKNDSKTNGTNQSNSMDLPLLSAVNSNEWVPADDATDLVEAINFFLLQNYSDPFIFVEFLEETDERITVVSPDGEESCTICYDSGMMTEIGFQVSGMVGFDNLNMAATVMYMLAADAFGESFSEGFFQWYAPACDQIAEQLYNSDYASALYETVNHDAAILLEAVFEGENLVFILTMGEKNKFDSAENHISEEPEEEPLVISEKNQVKGTFLYEKLDDGTVSVYGFKPDSNSPVGALVIPDQIDGFRVSEFEYDEFDGTEDYVRELILSDGIESSMFYNTSDYIERIHIGKSIKNINTDGSTSFAALKEYTVSKENTNFYSLDGVLFASNGFEDYPFKEEGNTLIDYPPGKAEAEYIVPDGVESICSWAFSQCHNLNRVVLPDSMKARENDFEIFYNCKNLNEVYMGANVQFEGSPFSFCRNLQNIEISPQNKHLIMKDGVLIDQTKKMLIYYMPNNLSNNYTVDDDIQSIADDAFGDHREGLYHVKISEGVQKIGDSVFVNYTKDRESIRSISLPMSLREFGFDAFSHSTTLEVVEGSYAETYAKENGYEYEYISYSDTAAHDPILLTIGSRGEHVKRLQEALIKFGWNGTADGIYGKQTAAVVMAMQELFGVEQTGIVDEEFYYAFVEN